MFRNVGSVAVEEHKAGDATWIAVRARGAEWSWLTREDAVLLARHLIAAYDPKLDTAVATIVH